jgi:hypothetical protein
MAQDMNGRAPVDIARKTSVRLSLQVSEVEL